MKTKLVILVLALFIFLGIHTSATAGEDKPTPTPRPSLETIIGYSSLSTREALVVNDLDWSYGQFALLRQKNIYLRHPERQEWLKFGIEWTSWMQNGVMTPGEIVAVDYVKGSDLGTLDTSRVGKNSHLTTIDINREVLNEHPELFDEKLFDDVRDSAVREDSKALEDAMLRMEERIGLFLCPFLNVHSQPENTASEDYYLQEDCIRDYSVKPTPTNISTREPTDTPMPKETRVSPTPTSQPIRTAIPTEVSTEIPYIGPSEPTGRVEIGPEIDTSIPSVPDTGTDDRFFDWIAKILYAVMQLIGLVD